jgi:hypothetical protein
LTTEHGALNGSFTRPLHGELRRALTALRSILLSMRELCTCSICGEPIGVYERVLVIEDDSARASSLAREPDVGDHGATLIHRECAPRLTDERNQLLAAAGLTADR